MQVGTPPGQFSGFVDDDPLVRPYQPDQITLGKGYPASNAGTLGYVFDPWMSSAACHL